MAYYSEEFIEEIKSANDIVDVVSSYVNLKRHGTNFFGNCPFHREKTPSFSVAPEKQIYHCFGCGQGGNVISFIMKIENLGFQEAVEFLADRAKLDISAGVTQNSDEDEALKLREYHKSVLYNINRDAGKFFHQNIYSSNIAQDYINKRKLDIATVRKFGIGFAKDDNGLSKYLKEKGYKEQDLIASGLVGKAQSGVLYDKFKNRLMFPIFDIRGRVVAFGGRTLASNEEQKEKHIPKYINSPENLAYTKGRHLYGLNLAKNTGGKLKKILVVEGYMDVVSPVSKGVTNVVASLGTALTENQGKLLRKYTDEVILSYDSDVAGQNAIMRGIDILQNLGVTCKVLQMEGAKDPDEYVLKYGPEKFNLLIDNSISAVEYKIKVLKQSYDLNDTSEKIRFLNKMAEVLSKIPNNIERDIYIEKLSKEGGVGKEALIAEVEKFLFKEEGKKVININLPNNESKEEKSNTDSSQEETIIYLLTSKDKEIYNKIKENVEIGDFNNSACKNLLSKFYEAYENDSIKSIDLLSLCENEAETNLLTKLLLNENTIDDFSKISDKIIQSFTISKLEKRKEEINDLMKVTTDETEKNKLVSELREIVNKIVRK